MKSFTYSDYIKCKKLINQNASEQELLEMALAKCNVIDINDYTEDEILNEEGMILKAILLERAETSEETIEILNKILQQKLEEEEKKFLKEIIENTFLQDKIGKEKVEEILKKLK